MLSYISQRFVENFRLGGILLGHGQGYLAAFNVFTFKHRKSACGGELFFTFAGTLSNDISFS
jgi:hypothetical protein